MRISGWQSAGIALGGMVGIAVLLSASSNVPPLDSRPPRTPEMTLVLDPGASKLSWSVDSTLHMVHGTFAFKNGMIHFDPENGKADGEIVVLTASGESGNSARDERMHKEILETNKFPDAIFRPLQIEGKMTTSGSFDVKLQGSIRLHGSEHELSVPVHAEIVGDRWKGNTRFEVPYVEWGIKDPSNWLLKVKPIVHVELEMAGSSRVGD